MMINRTMLAIALSAGLALGLGGCKKADTTTTQSDASTTTTVADSSAPVTCRWRRPTRPRN